MQKKKIRCRELIGYFNDLCAFSAHVLASLCELSCVLLLLSFGLNHFANLFSNPILIHETAKACATTGMGLFAGGVVLALIADVVAKYDFGDQ